MKLVFMGHGKWATETLRRLVADGHEIVGVVCEVDSFDEKEKDHYARLSQFGFYESLKQTATSLGLPLYQPDKVNSSEFVSTLEKLNPDLIVIVSYHSIIKESVLEKFTVINAHGAPLPFYRGRAPINWAIINGEKNAGVTIHFIDAGIDTGDIILQELMPIEFEDTAIDILKKALYLYPELVSKAVKLIEQGQVTRIKQEPGVGSYFPKRKPSDGMIKWNSSSLDLYNFVRALTRPYPGAFTYYKGQKVMIWKAKIGKTSRVSPVAGLVFNNPQGIAEVSTADGSLLLLEYEIEDGKTLPCGARLESNKGGSI